METCLQRGGGGGGGGTAAAQEFPPQSITCGQDLPGGVGGGGEQGALRSHLQSSRQPYHYGLPAFTRAHSLVHPQLLFLNENQIQAKDLP